ncbi:tetratricopeptide repeat protein [Thiohalobacter thiocyanaticus]|uniref:Tetratricopeptide repeat protein n=1 Tax=Thiohalobacter thiocyanaticus TaxID=585455 RepID=A0A426QJS0_9GAMM|nr:tetratricopeptide repeat protein [Thiohalobacter thiocyanaticus]
MSAFGTGANGTDRDVRPPPSMTRGSLSSGPSSGCADPVGRPEWRRRGGGRGLLLLGRLTLSLVTRSCAISIARRETQPPDGHGRAALDPAGQPLRPQGRGGPGHGGAAGADRGTGLALSATASHTGADRGRRAHPSGTGRHGRIPDHAAGAGAAHRRPGWRSARYESGAGIRHGLPGRGRRGHPRPVRGNFHPGTPDPEPATPETTAEAVPVSAEAATDPDMASTPDASRSDRNAAGSTTPSMRKTPRPLSPAEQAEQHFADGLAALGQGQWRLAEQELQAALEADPGHLRARESLSGVLLYQGRRRDAEAVLAAGLEAHPYTPSLARTYARLILDQGRDDAAIEVLETALVNAVDDAGYLALLAGVYQRNQRYDEAAGSYRSALSLAPKRAAWWLGLGLALEGGGELERAAGAYRSAIGNPGLNANSRRFAEDRLQRLNHLLGRQ